MMNRIKQYRLAAGLTPADISAMFKIPYRTVQKWEKGELVPPAWAEAQIVNRLQEKQKNDRPSLPARKAPHIARPAKKV